MLLNHFFSFITVGMLFIASFFYGAANLLVWTSLFTVIIACWIIILLKNTTNSIVKIAALPAIFSILCVVYFYIQPFLISSAFSPPYFGKLGISLINIPNFINQYAVEITFYKWLLPLLLFFLIPQIITSSKQATFFLSGIIILGLTQAYLGYVQFLFYDPTISYMPKIQGDIHGTFVTRNSYACLLAVITILTSSWLLKFVTHSVKRSKKKNLLIAIWQSRNFSKIALLFTSVLFLLLPIFFSLSRGGIVSLFVSYLFFFILYVYMQNISWQKIMTTTKALIPVVIIFLFYVYLSSFQNIYDRFSLSVEKGEARWELWQVTWRIITDHSIFGTGGGSFFCTSPAYNQPDLIHFLYAHNDYLQLLSEYGIVGFLLVSCLIISWIFTAWNTRENSVLSKTLWAGVAASCAVFFCHAFVDFNFQVDSHRILCASLMGLLIAQKKFKIKKNSRSLKAWLCILIFTILATLLLSKLFCYSYASYLEPKKFFKTFHEKKHLDVVLQRSWMQKKLLELEESLKWNDRNPHLWYKIGFLNKEIAQIHIKKRAFYFKKAQEYLEKTRNAMPTFHFTYIHLAHVYYQQQEYKKSEHAMILAQTLAPYDYEYATNIIKYWWQCWRRKADPLYLKLIADRFFVLNESDKGDFHKSLNAWSHLASDYKEKEAWYGVIYPKKEHFSIEAAKYFIFKEDFTITTKIISQIKDSKIKNTLLGHISLYKNDVDSAVLLYKKGIKNDKIAEDVFFKLIKKNKFSVAISLLKDTFEDHIIIRLKIAKYALEQEINLQKIYTFLMDTKKKHSLTAEYFYTMAKVTKKMNKIRESFSYAEQAILKDKQNIVYLQYLLSHLFKRKMYKEVNLYTKKYELYCSNKFLLYKWLTRIYYDRKKYKNALLWGEKAESFDKSNQDFQFLLIKIRDQNKGDN